MAAEEHPIVAKLVRVIAEVAVDALTPPNQLYRCVRLALGASGEISFKALFALFAFGFSGHFLRVAMCRMARSQLLT